MKTLIISFLVLVNNLSLIFAQAEKISHRNWENCYLLKNEKCEVIINASSGGKVIWFALNGNNIIYENPQQDGKLLDDWKQKPFDPDGGRFDFGPEKITQPIHPLSWMGKWKAEITGSYSLKLTCITDSALGLQSDREFILNPDSAILTIHQTARNISEKTLVRHFWGRTLVKPNGYLWMPLNPESRFKHGWGRFLWDPDRVDSNPANDDRITIGKNNFRFHATGATLKGGTDAPTGWLAYELDDMVFVKKFKVFPESDYSGSDYMTGIFYSNGVFCELEPCSQTFTIKHNESVEFIECWELLIHQQEWSPKMIQN